MSVFFFLHHDNNMLAQTCPLVVNTDWSVKSPLCFQNRSALSVERLISLFDIKQKNIYDSAKDLRLHCYSSFKMSILKCGLCLQDLEGIKPVTGIPYIRWLRKSVGSTVGRKRKQFNIHCILFSCANKPFLCVCFCLYISLKVENAYMRIMKRTTVTHPNLPEKLAPLCLTECFYRQVTRC